MQHLPKFLHQLVRRPGRLAGLTNRRSGCLLLLIQISRSTSERGIRHHALKNLVKEPEERQLFE
jgi:hypothetical protein